MINKSQLLSKSNLNVHLTAVVEPVSVACAQLAAAKAARAASEAATREARKQVAEQAAEVARLKALVVQLQAQHADADTFKVLPFLGDVYLHTYVL